MRLFETERLIGRALSQQDLPALTEILSDPEVMEFSVRGVCDEHATSEFIEWCLGCYVSHGVGPWALVEKGTDDLIGFCGVGPELINEVEEINLGYRLAKRFWNRGMASEAAKAVLEYAFVVKHVPAVTVLIEPAHVASLRVAEKSGFQGVQEIDFHGHSVRLYRMTRERWGMLQ